MYTRGSLPSKGREGERPIDSCNGDLKSYTCNNVHCLIYELDGDEHTVRESQMRLTMLMPLKRHFRCSGIRMYSFDN